MKNKRMALPPLLLPVLLLFAACGGTQAGPTAYSSREMAQVILDTQEEGEAVRSLTPEDGGFGVHLSQYYGIQPEELEDGAVLYDGGTGAREIAVLELREGGDPAGVEQKLLDYIDSRIGEFFGYMPDQVYLLEQALVVSSGNHVALLVCQDPQAARDAFYNCFGQEAQPPGAALMAAGVFQAGSGGPADGQGYDHEAILEAWRSGDRSGLATKDRAILAAAAAVLDQVVEEGMSPYQQELAVHDWIIRWADYDVETKSRAPDASPHPDNDNPYGVFMGRRAICTGYTLTFQLLMDMLEIECITVHGTARETNEHAWNMVRLDGEWYCVDLTWNDPVGLLLDNAALQHEYFNVTSEYMRETNHQWDELTVPEATATRWQWVA